MGQCVLVRDSQVWMALPYRIPGKVGSPNPVDFGGLGGRGVIRVTVKQFPKQSVPLIVVIIIPILLCPLDINVVHYSPLLILVLLRMAFNSNNSFSALRARDSKWSLAALKLFHCPLHSHITNP